MQQAGIGWEQKAFALNIIEWRDFYEDDKRDDMGRI